MFGVPNTYLPFLQDCWRQGIPEIRDERDVDYPRHLPIEDLIIVPEKAEYYAAEGAALYDSHEPTLQVSYPGTEQLQRFIEGGREQQLQDKVGLNTGQVCQPLVTWAEGSELVIADVVSTYLVWSTTG